MGNGRATVVTEFVCVRKPRVSRVKKRGEARLVGSFPFEASTVGLIGKRVLVIGLLSSVSFE